LPGPSALLAVAPAEAKEKEKKVKGVVHDYGLGKEWNESLSAKSAMCGDGETFSRALFWLYSAISNKISWEALEDDLKRIEHLKKNPPTLKEFSRKRHLAILFLNKPSSFIIIGKTGKGDSKLGNLLLKAAPYMPRLQQESLDQVDEKKKKHRELWPAEFENVNVTCMKNAGLAFLSLGPQPNDTKICVEWREAYEVNVPSELLLDKNKPESYQGMGKRFGPTYEVLMKNIESQKNFAAFYNSLAKAYNSEVKPTP
jgi:hypothetical protein